MIERASPSRGSSGQQKIFPVLAAVLAVSMVMSWGLYFRALQQKDTVNIHSFPKEIAGWTSEELTITDDEYAMLETRNAFARRYHKQTGEEIYLLIVYSQNNRKVSHPPEICYTGSGASISGSSKIPVHLAKGKRVNANKYVIGMDGVRQVMVYWFKVGERFTANYWYQQGLIGLNTLLGKKTGSALIRLTVTIGEDGEEAAMKNVEQFSQQAYPLFLQYLP